MSEFTGNHILEDMDSQFFNMIGSFICGELVIDDSDIQEFGNMVDDYRRWMPDQIIDPSELVHQIEVK